MPRGNSSNFLFAPRRQKSIPTNKSYWQEQMRHNMGFFNYLIESHSSLRNIDINYYPHSRKAETIKEHGEGMRYHLSVEGNSEKISVWISEKRDMKKDWLPLIFEIDGEFYNWEGAAMEISARLYLLNQANK